MKKAKVLFVAQEITPYVKETPMGKIGRYLPQGIQEKGKEIRTFMPRYGLINERRNQLHEVIRLSGMNLIIDDTDHPLIIKVASIQQARMQIYFIDNEDYFQRKAKFADKSGKFFEDNDERVIFFARGVLETVKKLGWPPNIVHCHGWFASLTPAYIKKAYKDNPVFNRSKVVLSLYNEGFDQKLNKDFSRKLKMDGMAARDVKKYNDPDYVNYMKGAIDHSDALVIGSEDIDPAIEKYARDSKKPLLDYQPEETYIEAYNNFYDQLLEDEED